MIAERGGRGENGVGKVAFLSLRTCTLELDVMHMRGWAHGERLSILSQTEPESNLRVNRVLSNLIVRIYPSRDNVRGTNVKTGLVCCGAGGPPPLTWEGRLVGGHCFVHCCVDLRCPVLPLRNVCIGAKVPPGARVVCRLVPKLEVVDLVLLQLHRCHGHVPGDIDTVIPKVECRDEPGSLGEVIPTLVLDV